MRYSRFNPESPEINFRAEELQSRLKPASIIDDASAFSRAIYRSVRMKYIRLILFTLCTLHFALCTAFAGSPFYLTIERSFSNTEKAQIRLDYTETYTPMLIRVLRPKNLDRFLDGQLHISRSYEKPITDLNPGYYFVKGLNNVESPLKAFRNMLDSDFRANFRGSAFHQAILTTTNDELASAPGKVILAPPDGFTAEREFYLDLQKSGASDPGWWFDSTTLQQEHYKIRTIALNPLSDGIYLLQAVQGTYEAQSLLQISSLSVQVKQSSSQIIVRAVGRDAAPIQNASVSFRDGRGKWTDIGKKTDASGEASFDNSAGLLDGKLIVRVQTQDNRQALADTDFLPTTTNDDAVFIVTDRPIFKPGETFFYKGMIRGMDNGLLAMPKLGDKYGQARLIRADGTETDIQSRVSVTDFGSFSGSFDLDDAITPGLYRLVAEIGGKPYGGEFRVRDYVKPTYYLELIDKSPTVVPGEKFFVKFKAKRFAGGVPKDVKFDVYLYQKKFEVPQWVVESGGGLSSGTDYFGEVRSASALTEPKRIYSSVSERFQQMGIGDGNPWDSAPKMDDESGLGEFEFVMPKSDSQTQEEYIYTLIVRTMDKAGSQSVLSENIYVTLSEAQPAVRFSKSVAKVGERGLSVSVRSTYPDGKPAPKAGGVIDMAQEVIGAAKESSSTIRFTTDNDGVSQFNLPDIAKHGRLIAVATLETLDGKPMKHPAKSQPEAMIVGGPDGVAILDNRDTELYTDSTILSPGEKAKVFALLPANWGKGENGTIWETVSGRKVYKTSSSVFKGRSRWFEVEAKPEYGTGFYHTVTVPMAGGKYREKTIGFRIIPLDKRLSVTILPDRQEAEPLKPFKVEFEVRDNNKKPAPDTELTVTIVDRAIYSVQPEMRPGVFDFYYPLPRLNLATFYSDELQGYGYADILKKPNFRLGALKSQSKLPKKGMRDTAGWFPHVMTDADGKASITVDLPANVTEWLITAIAADKNGRLGEGKGKFRTVSDISVEVNSPKFLREGETAAIQIKAINHLSQQFPVKAKVDVVGDASVRYEKQNLDFTLDKLGEHLMPLRIDAKGADKAATIKAALQTTENIHVGGAEEFDIPLKPSAMKQVFSAARDKERLLTDLPETAKITQVRVEVSSGLLGAALNAASVLVSYPYGCTEQLVHSTIPNLVLMDLVKKAGLNSGDLGALADTLKKAERNAAIGIKKIMQNQKSDGGFGLWSSDPEPSIAVTLTAAYSLKFADDLEIEGADRAYNKASAWLQRSEKEWGNLTGYELSKIAELGFYDQPWEQQIAYAVNVHKNANAQINDLIYALKIFAASKDKNWNRFQQKFKAGSVQKDLIARLKTQLDQLDPEAYGKVSRVEFLQTMGFGFGVPYIVSAGMGVLADLKSLDAQLEGKLKRVLQLSVKNGFWISTFDSAQVIFNTRHILAKEAAEYAAEKKAKPRTISARKKDGSVLGELSRIPKGFVGIFANPGTPALLSEIRLEGLGNADTAYSTITADVPFDAVTPIYRGLSIERSFTRITPKSSEPWDSTQPLRKGDTIISEIRVKRQAIGDAMNVPSHFVVIEEGIPSLGEGIDDDKTYLADAKIKGADDSYRASVKETQRYPDRTVIIAKVMPSGEIRAYQVWRAAFSGKASIPPARAFDMYDESVRGNSEALKVLTE